MTIPHFRIKQIKKMNKEEIKEILEARIKDLNESSLLQLLDYTSQLKQNEK